MTRYLLAIVVVLSCVSQTSGFDVRAVIRKIDVDNRTAVVFANGRERTVKVAADAKFLSETGDDLQGGLTASELKEGAAVILTVEPVSGTPTIVTLKLGGRSRSLNQLPRGASVGRPTVGFIPLTEMTAADRYKDEDGGLYGQGRNEIPQALAAEAKKVTAQIQPLDGDGTPTAIGKIGLVSISMSNATQEFSRFKQIADRDPQKSPRVHIIDCAQGGQTMARWADSDAACWKEADRRLQAAGVSLDQVQVAWVKLANARPSGDLQQHGKQLQKDTRTVLANLHEHFPNLKIAYLGSRIYGGYADGELNPEPFAYEGAFVVRWLILGQLNSSAALIRDSESPLLLWGPYFWADGTTPRESDGLIWERSDFVNDGTHPSDTGRQKVAEQLLNFLKRDQFARTWFVKE